MTWLGGRERKWRDVHPTLSEAPGTGRPEDSPQSLGAPRVWGCVPAAALSGYMSSSMNSHDHPSAQFTGNTLTHREVKELVQYYPASKYWIQTQVCLPLGSILQSACKFLLHASVLLQKADDISGACHPSCPGVSHALRAHRWHSLHPGLNT